MNRIKEIVLRQYTLPLVGGLKSQISGSMFYYGMFQYLSTSITLYAVAIAPWAAIHLGWFNIWTFLGGLAVIFLAIPLLNFKFMFPSEVGFGNVQAEVGFGNVQAYIHNNPFVKDLHIIIKKLDNKADKADFQAVLKKLGKIETKLGIEDEL